MPFKQALLQHVIRHYPAFILQAASVALTDSKTSVAPKDSGSTTFGKFTVQFKGNLVVTMVTDGLLGMLLDTLHSLLLEAARAEGVAASAAVMHEEGEDEEAAEEEAAIELGSDELFGPAVSSRDEADELFGHAVSSRDEADDDLWGRAVSSRDEADEPADEPVALSPNGAVAVGWRLADVAGGPSEMMDVEASPLAGSASGVGGVRNLVERYEWTAAEDELTLGSVEEYGSKWTSTLVAAAGSAPAHAVPQQGLLPPWSLALFGHERPSIGAGGGLSGGALSAPIAGAPSARSHQRQRSGEVRFAVPERLSHISAMSNVSAISKVSSVASSMQSLDSLAVD